MTIKCALQGHAAGDDCVWNEGYFFSDCARCGRGLVRTSGNWRAIRRGYRIVWRSGSHRHAIPSNFKRNLPLVIDRRPWWKLGLTRKGAGCIMLPADTVDRDDRPVAGMPVADLFAAAIFILIEAVFRPAASARKRF